MNNDARILEEPTYIFDQVKQLTPTLVLYHSTIDVLPDSRAEVDSFSSAFEKLVRRAAAQTNVPFVSSEQYLIESYRESGQPGSGFSNKNIVGGHLNLRGHRATALALAAGLNEANVNCHVDVPTSEVLIP